MILMPRMARAVLPDVPHHVTQRGVNREPVFFSDADRRVYLDLVRTGAERLGVALIGYCLMSNHAHWIVVPPGEDSLARLFGEAHYHYAHYVNTKLTRIGHLWQNRFFSCALDEVHLWVALRYVERNPVRAGLVAAAEDWRWSSAAVHAAGEAAPSWLSMEAWAAGFTCHEWRVSLASSSYIEAEVALRKSTHAGRPLGSKAFVERAEGVLGRMLHAEKGGRPPKPKENTVCASFAAQGILFDMKTKWKPGNT